MDTAPDASGKDVKPWVLENYDGNDIVLNAEKNIIMSPSVFPNLKQYIGQDLILTDGTTLLGGDDKASIAVVMTLLEYLVKHPEIKHNFISVAFTPDEEVSGLAKDLDLERFKSPIAYTLDGDHLGYYMDETFNANIYDFTTVELPKSHNIPKEEKGFIMWLVLMGIANMPRLKSMFVIMIAYSLIYAITH